MEPFRYPPHAWQRYDLPTSFQPPWPGQYYGFPPPPYSAPVGAPAGPLAATIGATSSQKGSSTGSVDSAAVVSEGESVPELLSESSSEESGIDEVRFCISYFTNLICYVVAVLQR